jgi:hypothetical protein
MEFEKYVVPVESVFRVRDSLEISWPLEMFVPQSVKVAGRFVSVVNPKSEKLTRMFAPQVPPVSKQSAMVSKVFMVPYG